MRISYLELHNIKSYGEPTRIALTGGLNAICGLNGSGKTTVLEAIGFALFDFLAYPQQAFLREGQKSGTIRLGLVGRDDRQYEVVRRVGAGSGHFVADLETGARIAERKETLVWVREKALDIEGEADLAALFKNAVGVPQGLMTADFQQSAGVRKNIFDPLLRVEEYRQAYESLRETSSYLTGLTGTVREEIARLEQETEQIPDLRERVDELRRQTGTVEERLAVLAGDLSAVGEQKAALDAGEERCRECVRRLQTAQYDQQRFADMLDERQQALASAERAQAAVQQTEPGYRLVEEARERLRELEREREERDALNAQSAQVNARLNAINGRIEGRRTEWQAARSAGEEAEELCDLARRQDELDAAINAAEQRLDERKGLTQRVEQVKTEIGGLQRAMTATDRRLHDATAAQQEIGALDGVRRDLETVGGRLAQLEPIRDRLKEITAEGQRLREQFDGLEANAKRHGEIEQVMTQRLAEAAPLEDLNVRRQTLREERARTVATIEYQTVARAELRAHHCPLLDLTCPVVESDTAVLARFEERVGILESRAGEIEGEIAALTEPLAAAKRAADELQRLQVELARLAPSLDRRDALSAELERCRRQYADLAEQVTGEQSLSAQRDKLLQEIKRLEERASVAALLPELTDRRQGEEDRLSTAETELTALVARGQELAAVEREHRELTRERDVLGDPRGRRIAALAIAGREPQLAAQLAAEQALLDEQNDRLKAIVGQMQRFAQLDEIFAEQRSVEDAHAAEHTRYLQSRDEAGKLAERQTARDEMAANLERARRTVGDVEAELAQAVASYDRDHHEEVRLRYREIDNDITVNTTQRSYLLADLDRAEKDLAHLRRRQVKLEEKRAEQDELGRLSTAVTFVRTTLKAAGPAVTESLLANISQGANDIYAEIVDDHAVELRWDRDYEVLVQRGAETRKFAQLSGGEQMSAALAVRLALLREMSEVDFAFFDEPTQNMDGERRSNLADQIRQVRGFDQLIVISHDDTFEHHTDNLIRLRKIHETTEVIEGQGA